MVKTKKIRHVTIGSHLYVLTALGITRRRMNEPQRERICGPFRFKEHRSLLGGDEIKVAVEFKDCNDVIKTFIASRSDISDGNRLIDKLIDRGFDVRDRQMTAKLLKEFYRKFPPRKTTLMTSEPGWHKVDGSESLVYVANGRLFKPSNCECNVVLTEEINAGFAAAGNLASWNENVGRYCIGNSRLEFAVCFMLAAFTLRLSGLPNFGAHLHGPRKTGKTTAEHIAGSVVGNLDFLLSWNSTDNAIEGMASSRNDGVIVLDEIGQSEARAASNTAYNLMNGISKSRLGADGKLNSGIRFTGLLMSSGEHDLRTHLEKEKIKVMPGQLARLLCIPVSGPHGVFYELHGHTDGGALASTIFKNIALHHGTLGPAFVTYLAENQTALRATLPDQVRELATDLLSALDGIPDQGAYNHVAKSFALVAVAGELAIENDLLDWQQGEARKAVNKCFLAWAKHDQKNNYTDDDILRHLKKFFGTESRNIFSPLCEFDYTANSTLAGYRHMVDGGNAFLVIPAVFEAALCSRFGKFAAIRALKNSNLLILGGHNTPTRQVAVPKDKRKDGKEKVSFYVIREAILDS